ncbi:MAG: hypothetical protein VB878_18105 [Pirellulaceae bacterium]
MISPLDAIITFLRVPFGLIGTVFLVAFLPVETIMWLVCAPLGALFLSRESFKVTWLGRYPSCFEWMGMLWEWVRDE